MQFVNSAKRLVFDLTEIPFLKCLISIYRLIAKVLNDRNLFTESNLVNWFSSYVQFCSGDHFSKRAEAALKSGKMNHLKALIEGPDSGIQCEQCLTASHTDLILITLFVWLSVLRLDLHVDNYVLTCS